jgi:hypothetical protein
MQTTETFNTSHFTQLIVQRANVTPEATHECSRQALLLEATSASVSKLSAPCHSGRNSYFAALLNIK